VATAPAATAPTEASRMNRRRLIFVGIAFSLIGIALFFGTASTGG
jgi:hypothetical protein